MSLKATLNTGLGSDDVNTIMLWYGIKQYGLSFISTWNLTKDNWFFSLLPLHALLFSLFGAKLIIVSITGWLIYVFSALISGVIAWQVKSKKAWWWVLLLLIFQGSYAYQPGLVAYSISHNITNLFGLLSLVLLIYWLHNTRNRWLAVIGILCLLTMAGLSDPWLLPTYLLPLFLTSILLFFRPHQTILRKGDRWYLFLVLCLAMILVSTKCLFLLHFLPHISYHFVTSWSKFVNNFYLLIEGLGGWFNLIPWPKLPSDWLSGSRFISSMISLVLVSVLLSYVTYIAWKKTLPISLPTFILYLFIGLSVTIMTLSFLFNADPNIIINESSARYLISIFYLVVIYLVLQIDHNWIDLSIIWKMIAILLTTLFLISGVSGHFDLLQKPGVHFRTNDNIIHFIKFLQQHDLTFGYGSYNDSHMVTVLSQQQIIMRPIFFTNHLKKMMIGQIGQSSKLLDWWYRPSKYYFIALSSDQYECRQMSLSHCIHIAIQQFGEPLKTLHYGHDVTILVWNYPLVRPHQYK